MKKLSKQNFDEIFKGRFKNYEVAPPDNVLNNIKQDIYSSSNNTGLKEFFISNKWMLSGGIAVIVISGIISLSLINNETTNDKALLPNNLTSSISDKSANIETDNLPEVSAINISQNKETVINLNKTIETTNFEFVENHTNYITNKNIKANAGADIKICGLNCELKAILSNKENNGYWNYIGTKDVAFKNSNKPITNVQVNDFGKYNFIWTERNEQNSSTDTLIVEFMKSGNIKVDYHVIAATCENNNGAIELYTQDNNKYIFYWENESTPTESYRYNLKSGIYKINVIDNLKCKETISVQVNDSGIVTAKFYHIELALNVGVPIYFSDASKIDGNDIKEDDIVEYKWNFGDGAISTEKNPEKIYSSKGIFSVKLIVTSAPGCVDSSIINNISIENSDIQQPTYFTPNGDGINDTYYVKAKKLENFKGYITDKTGKVIFEWNNPDKGWDGKLKDGSPAQKDLYYYFIQGVDESGKECRLNNFFYLRR